MSNWQSLLATKQGETPSVTRSDEHYRVILVGQHANGTYGMMANGNYLVLFVDAAFIDATLAKLKVPDTGWK